MTELAVVLKPDLTEQITLSSQAKGLIIQSSEDYVYGGDLFKSVDAEIKNRKEFFKPMKDKAFAAHKQICKQEEESVGELLIIKTDVKRKLETYDAEQVRIAREEEARLREIARKEEEERRIQEALQAEADGEKELADEILKEEVYVPPVTVMKATPKVSGVIFRTYWKHEVKDLKKLVKAVFEGRAPLDCLEPNNVFLGAEATSRKRQEEIYPGVFAYSVRL